jgi:hypothetical protein
MTPDHSRSRAVAFSVRVYEILLLAYPREFRTEYGPKMLQAFCDRCRQRIRDSGMEGMLGWWLVTGIDFVSTVLEQHLRRENYMSRRTLIRIGSWSLMLAAVAFVLAFTTLLPQAQSSLGDLFLIVATFLTSVGTIGVIYGFDGAARPAGKPMLIVGVVASLLLYTAPLNIWSHMGDPYWLIPYLGPAILLACLAGYGLIALRRSFLPTDTAIALLGGIWLLLLIIPAGFFAIWDIAPGFTQAWMILGCFITAFALGRLGWRLRLRAQDPTPAV